MEQKNVSPEKKDSILKSLAIAGFIGMLLLVAWLSVQMVNLLPSAFGSLASLADGVSQYQETTLGTETELSPLTVTSNTSLLNTGENMTINWSEVNSKGSFVFSYECVDGVAITHITELGQRAVDCDTNYNVGDINTLTIGIESEKNRYADVAYALAFLRTSEDAPRAQGDSVITVVNTDVDSQLSVTSDTVAVTQPTAAPEPTVSQTTVEAPETSAPVQTPAFEQQFSYTVPVSNPDGYVDLAVSFIDTGEIINGTFVPGPVNSGYSGAIQFSVKNLGTKTSRDWTYGINLPNNQTYQSDDQVELKPNERAVLTVGFPAGASSEHTFAVTVDERTDQADTNDSFTQTVVFAS